MIEDDDDDDAFILRASNSQRLIIHHHDHGEEGNSCNADLTKLILQIYATALLSLALPRRGSSQGGRSLVSKVKSVNLSRCEGMDTQWAESEQGEQGLRLQGGRLHSAYG